MHFLATVLRQGVCKLGRSAWVSTSKLLICLDCSASESLGVMTRRVPYFKCVELDIGISMRQPPDEALDHILRAISVAVDTIADVYDSSPILGGEILVGRFGFWE